MDVLRDANDLDDAIDWVGDLIKPAELKGPFRKFRRRGCFFTCQNFFVSAGADVDAPTTLVEVVAHQLNDAGRVEEEITWLREAVATGDQRAPALLARLLDEMGRTDDALEVCRQGMKIAAFNIRPLAQELLKKTGRVEEAERLKRYGIEPNDRTASSLD